MAKDLPEYKRTQSIQPQAAPVGFNQAVQGVSQSYEILGAMSAQVASDAATQRAQLAGLEAGKEPGKTLLPAITDVDKVFNNVYREESAKVLNSSANSALDNLTFEIAKDPMPTGQTLSKFEEEAAQIKAQTLALADPLTKSNLERAIDQKYYSDYYSLAGRVQEADFKRLLQNANVATKTNLENIFNYKNQGLEDAAQNSIETERQNQESIRYLIGEDKYQQNIDNLRMVELTSTYESKLNQLQKNQGELAAAEYLKNFVLTEQKDITPAEKDAIIPQLYNRYAQNRKVLGISQSLEYSNANLEMLTSGGNLSNDRWQYYEENLSHEQFNDLQSTAIKMQGRGANGAHLVGEMVNDFNSTINMAKYTGGQKDNVFLDLVNAQKERIEASGQAYSNPLLHQANIAANIKSDIPVFTEALEQTIKYGSFNDMIDAGKAIKMLQVNNPISVATLDKDARAASDLFNAYRLDESLTPEKAIEKARNDVYNVTPEIKQERANQYNAWSAKKGFGGGKFGQEKLEKFIQAGMDLNPWFGRKVEMPPGFSALVQTLLPSYYARLGDGDLAAKEMFEDLKQTYKITNINGDKQLMAYAPEQMVEALDKGHFLENDKAYNFYKFVQLNKELSKDPRNFVMHDIEWPKNPFDGQDINNLDFISETLVPNAFAVKIDGIERQVVIRSDELTSISDDGVASWPYFYKDDNGVEQPLVSINTPGGKPRWVPDIELFNKNVAKKTPKELSLEQLKKIRNETLLNPTVNDVSFLYGGEENE